MALQIFGFTMIVVANFWLSNSLLINILSELKKSKSGDRIKRLEKALKKKGK